MLFLISFFATLVIGDCVVVTGATGFVASHVIEILFEKGYTVHGTVRDPSNKNKTAHLRKLQKKYDAELKLFKADLLEPNPFDLAVKGCTEFLHIASPVRLGKLEHQEERLDLVDSAVKGTLSALNAAYKAKMRTMIITSSVASLAPSKAKDFIKLEDCKYPYNESDWNDLSTLEEGTYGFSKTQAELATNEWMSKFKTPPFRLATVHFPLAIGPQLSTRVTSSNVLIYSTVKRTYPFLIPLYTHLVDIRDVARGHVLLLENTKAEGRYIISIDQHLSARSWSDMSQHILEAEDLKSLPVPTFVLPAWVLRFFLWLNLDNQITEKTVQRAFFGHQCGFDGSKITRELGFEYKYTDMKITVQDAARSMVRLGIAGGESQKALSFKMILILFLVISVVLGFILCCCRRRKDKKD